MQQKKKTTIHSILFLQRFPSLPFILKWLLLSLLIGISVGSASAFFLQTLDLVTQFRESHLWLISLLPIGGFFVGLIYHHFGKEIESGNNLLIDAAHEPQKAIPFIMAPLVYVGTIVTHLLGGSAGREGTALQMAGAITSPLRKLFSLKSDERSILVIAAIASGFGSVFGTPIAGAVFALEVCFVGRVKHEAIFPAIAASVFADIITRMWHTQHTQYKIDFIPNVNFLSVLYAIVVGVLFGLCAASFSKIIHWFTAIVKSFNVYPPLRTLFGGVMISIFIWVLGTTKYIGLGLPTLELSFHHQMPIYDFAFKMIFTIFTLSVGFKGGEVTPLFYIGATLGSALSLFIPLPTGLLAGMGFVAVFAGATNTPIASTIMALELFGSECGVFVAIACVVSFLMSGKNSIYNHQIIGGSKHIFLNESKGKRIFDVR